LDVGDTIFAMTRTIAEGLAVAGHLDAAGNSLGEYIHRAPLRLAIRRSDHPDDICAFDLGFARLAWIRRAGATSYPSTHASVAIC
jgi:hypothetical protein